MTPTSEQLDGLTELINIGVGKGASVLNSMMESNVELQVPSLKVVSSAELREAIGELGNDRLLSVNLQFTGRFSGMAELVFPAEKVSEMVRTLNGEDPDSGDIDSLRKETLCEVGNIVLNGVVGGIANMLKLPLNFTGPNYVEGNAEEFLKMAAARSQPIALVASTRMVIERFELEGEILLFFEEGSFDALLQGLVLSGIMMG